ncbi:MAG: sodium:glutamate symporter [Desulfobacteraceae bacterium]|nr:sodium:glutamate symporter [Desulfobacteraceae bacterium]
MKSAPLAILKDFCFMALLLFVGKVMRVKIRFFQDFFIPASVIAGFIGLILGPQMLNVIPFSAVMGKYAWLLVVLLFATFPIGQKAFKSKKEIIDKAGSTFFFSLFSEVAQFALAAVLGLTVMKLFWPDLHEGFAWMLPAGFAGGHGYATAIGGTLEKLGFHDAITVGMTMATIGLLVAIFGGVLLIRAATRKQYTRIVKEAGSLPESLRTGLIPQEERLSVGEQTVSPMSIDPLAWHAALIFAATLGGIYLTKWISQISWLSIGGKALYMPEVCTAMIGAMAIQKTLVLLKMDGFVDKQVSTRLGSCFSDFMVGFGVASIKISVVVTFWQPLLLLILLGMGWVLFNLYVIAPRMSNNYWFERGIFNFGWCTGVVAFGVTLLRIVDPNFESETLEDYGLAYILIAPIELFLVSLSPIFYATYGLATTLALVLAAAGILLAAKALGFWYSGGRSGERASEASHGKADGGRFVVETDAP